MGNCFCDRYHQPPPFPTITNVVLGRNGVGEIHYEDGSVYHGNLFRSLPHGQGYLCYGEEGLYCGHFSYGQRHGSGVNVTPDGIIHAGEWRYGKEEGFGERTLKDGSAYQGNFRNGLYHGKGLLKRTEETIEGNWMNGLLQGRGKITKVNGDEIFGTFENDILRGPGEILYHSNNQRAETDQPSRSGEGNSLRKRLSQKNRTSKPTPNEPTKSEEHKQTKANTSSGCVDVDDFIETEPGNEKDIDDKPVDKQNAQDRESTQECSSSQSVLSASDIIQAPESPRPDVSSHLPSSFLSDDSKRAILQPIRYVGELFNGDPFGQGEIFFATGQKCLADFNGKLPTADDVFLCVFTYANGEEYSGEMLNYRRHGQGVMRFIDGSIYSGQFFQDIFHGIGTYLYPDTSNFRGEWVYGKRQKGVFAMLDGSRYEGSFDHDQMHGHGIIYYESKDGDDEDIFVGKFDHGTNVNITNSLRLAPVRFYQHKIWQLNKEIETLTASANAVDPSTLCVLCKTRPRDIVFLECSHLAVCHVCCGWRSNTDHEDGESNIQSVTDDVLPACPECKSPIDQLILVHDT